MASSCVRLKRIHSVGPIENSHVPGKSCLSQTLARLELLRVVPRYLD